MEQQTQWLARPEERQCQTAQPNFPLSWRRWVTVYHHLLWRSCLSCLSILCGEVGEAVTTYCTACLPCKTCVWHVTCNMPPFPCLPACPNLPTTWPLHTYPSPTPGTPSLPYLPAWLCAHLGNSSSLPPLIRHVSIFSSQFIQIFNHLFFSLSLFSISVSPWEDKTIRQGRNWVTKTAGLVI